MSEKPRRWFQIHLSTAVVMMFVAGGLIWANVVGSNFEYSPADNVHPNWDSYTNFGWPMRYRFELNPKLGTVEPSAVIWPRLFGDIAIALLILGVVSFVCEWRTHRREARKP